MENGTWNWSYHWTPSFILVKKSYRALVSMRYREPTTGLKYPMRSSELSEPRFSVVSLSVTDHSKSHA